MLTYGCELFCVTPPLPNGGGVNRTSNLHRACRGASGVTLIKTQDIVLPRQIEKLSQAPASLLLVADEILIIHFQKRIPGQYRSPVLGKPAICQIIFGQLN